MVGRAYRDLTLKPLPPARVAFTIDSRYPATHAFALKPRAWTAQRDAYSTSARDFWSSLPLSAEAAGRVLNDSRWARRKLQCIYR